MKAQRIQLRRTKGWRLPGNTVVVARPSKWGNPFKVDENITPNDAVQAYEAWLGNRLSFQFEISRELRGKNLACWCRDGQPCHANILLRIANKPRGT